MKLIDRHETKIAIKSGTDHARDNLIVSFNREDEVQIQQGKEDSILLSRESLATLSAHVEAIFEEKARRDALGIAAALEG